MSVCSHYSVSVVTGCESIYSRKVTETLENVSDVTNAVMLTIVMKFRTNKRSTQARYRQRQNKKMKKLKVNASNELIPTAAKFLSIESELLDRSIKEGKKH